MSSLVEPLDAEELGQELRDFQIVQIREGKVSIARQACLREAQDTGIPSVTVNSIGELPGISISQPPPIQEQVRVRADRNVVTIDNLDWNAGQR